MTAGGAIRCVAWADLGTMFADERRRSGALAGLDAAARRLARRCCRCDLVERVVPERRHWRRSAQRRQLVLDGIAASEPLRIARRHFSACASRKPKRVLQEVLVGALPLELPVVQSSELCVYRSPPRSSCRFGALLTGPDSWMVRKVSYELFRTSPLRTLSS